MGQYHTVAPGEYLSQIAQTYGFASYKTIWNAGENADLKAERKNPNVLLPGDKLFIPDKELRNEDRATGSKHQFVVDTEKLKLRLKLIGLKKEPLPGHDCTLVVDGNPEDLVSDGDGTIEKDIASTASQGIFFDRGKSDDKIP